MEADTTVLMNEEMNFDKMNGLTDGRLLRALTNRCLNECSERPLCILGFIILLANSYHLVYTCALEVLDVEAAIFFLTFLGKKKKKFIFYSFLVEGENDGT